MLELRYILIAVVSALIILVSIILLKYRKLIKVSEVSLSKEQVLGRMFLRKIRKLGEPKPGEDPKNIFRDLNHIMREFFRELYDISYEFAYIELNEELIKKGVDEKLRNEIIDYTMRMAESEYSKRQVTEQEFYYLLGKSIKIIERVTGHTEEGVKVPEKAPAGEPKPAAAPEKPEELKPEPAVAPERPAEVKPEPAKPVEPAPAPEEAQKATVKEEPPPVRTVPEKEAPPVERPEVPPTPSESEKEMEKEILVPKKDDEKLDKLRRLLNTAEMNMHDKKSKDAMENYTGLREIYESLPQEMKMQINNETKRIITLYNSLLKEYKDILRS